MKLNCENFMKANIYWIRLCLNNPGEVKCNLQCSTRYMLTSSTFDRMIDHTLCAWFHSKCWNPLKKMRYMIWLLVAIRLRLDAYRLSTCWKSQLTTFQTRLKKKHSINQNLNHKRACFVNSLELRIWSESYASVYSAKRYRILK